MIFMIILTVSALLILIVGLLEIKMHFISKQPDKKSKKVVSFKPPVNIDDKLVKDSVENTVRNTRFLKQKENENIF